MKVAIVSSARLTTKTLKAEAYIPGAAVQRRLKTIRQYTKTIKSRVECIERLLKEIDDIEQEAFLQAVQRHE